MPRNASGTVLLSPEPDGNQILDYSILDDIESSRREGTGVCDGHHGEILQGAFLHAGDGPLRGLTTLPCPSLRTIARFTPLRQEPITTIDKAKTARHALDKTHAAARVTLDHLQLPNWGGRIELESNIPPGRGCGSSTADVVATIRAVADSFGRRLSAATVAHIAVTSESASDSVMFDCPVLFAQTRGEVLDSFTLPLPDFTVLGFDVCSAADEIDTLAMRRPSYTSAEIDLFEMLRSGLRRAITTNDPSLLGAVASGSTRIQLRHRTMPLVERVLDSASAWGALGVQVAHSGTVAGVLLPVGDAAALSRTGAELSCLTDGRFWRFDVRS